MKGIYICCLYLLGSFGLWGQNYKEDLKQMTSLYQNMDKYSTEVHVTTYETLTSKHPSFFQKTIIKKNGDSFFYQFNNNTMLVNSKYSVMVDTEQKSIIYKALKKADKVELDEVASMKGLEKVMEQYKSVKFKGVKAGVKHYVIYPKHTFNKVELFLLSNGLIKKIIYDYKGEKYGVQRMIADFKKSTTTPNYSKLQFSEKQFFTRKGKKNAPTAKYKNFKLIKVTDNEG